MSHKRGPNRVGCLEPGCERTHYGKGLCNLHWYRATGRGRLPRAPQSEQAKGRMYARRREQLTGWTPDLVASALIAQESKCALCGIPFDSTRGGKFVADHDHSTGRTRALLHSRCNLAVGQYELHGEALKYYVEAYRG